MNVQMCRDYVDQAVKFLECSRRLTDSYVLDFYTENHWESLPHSWRQTLLDVPCSELANLLAFWEPLHSKATVMPLSLLCFRTCTEVYSLSRVPIDGLSVVANWLEQNESDNNKVNNMQPFPKDLLFNAWAPTLVEELKSPCGQNETLQFLFRKHVKPKKQHEIRRVGEVVSYLSWLGKCNQIYDIGSGIGHLARLLSGYHGLNVRSFELNSEFVDRAKNLDRDLVRSIMKGKLGELAPDVDPTSGPRLPRHTNQEITLGTECQVGFHHEPGEKPLITGLHTCGDLAVSLVKEFVHQEDVQAILSLGCCYMKLNGGLDKAQLSVNVESDDPRLRYGYPLSQHLKLNPKSGLSYTARELSCHAIEKYVDKLRLGQIDDLKVHAYRALLEWFIIRRHPERRREGLRSVKKMPTKTPEHVSFQYYAQKATELLSFVEFRELGIDSEQDWIEACLHRWKQVVIYFSLRLMLAPVIESVILLDRLLFISEAGHPALILPLFDPRTSPRNLALMAIKRATVA